MLIHALRGRPAAVRARLRRESPQDLAVSSITVAELWYGAEQSRNPSRVRAAWAGVLKPFEMVGFDRSAAQEHARVPGLRVEDWTIA